MNVKKIIAGILSCTTAFSMSVFYNSQPTFSADSYYIVGDESTINESLDNVIEVADLTISTETTTTEIQTTEPIETTVVEETTITTVAETTTTETTTTYIVGDADENGKLNVRDAAFIARALARKEADTLPKSADFNVDGKIDVRDAAAIARHLASRYNEEPVVTSVSNDISVGVTTSTHIAHYRPAESCTCVINEDTELCPLCGIPLDCTCGLDVTTTTVSDEGDTTTTTAVGNDDTTTTTQTAETINTLPVETTVALPNENTTTTITATTTTTGREVTKATTNQTTLTDVNVTEDPSTTTTFVITTADTFTTAHSHKYKVETEIVKHEAEYQTKTVWMNDPYMYDDPNLTFIIGDDTNRYYPNPDESLDWYEDPTKVYYRANTYDLLCYFEGSWDALVEQYRDDYSHFILYIDKTNFTKHGITEEQWYDPEYMKKYCFESYGALFNEWVSSGYIGDYDYWGNKTPEFNPELDSIVIINGNWICDVEATARGVDEVFSNSALGCMSTVDRFLPVAQETVLVEDAWTEIVTHEVCECGHVKE